MSRFLVVPYSLVLLAASQAAFAQQPLGGGGEIQQIPRAPMLQNAAPALPISPRPAAVIPLPTGAKFIVRSLHVTSQNSFSETDLIVAAQFLPGSEVQLADLQIMAARITEYYNRHGYFVARAYLPQQDVTDGTVTIGVIEGQYGNVSLNNQTNISSDVLDDIISGLDTGKPVRTSPLERRLLLLSDLPGVAVKSTMSPGAAIGTSDLQIDVTRKARVSGSIEADNWGNPYTGTYRLGGTLNFNEPFGRGDVLSVRGFGSTTGDLAYGRISYQAQFGDATVGVAYTAFKYRLGKQFGSLDAHGTEQIVSVYASYPLIRSYRDNLNVLVDFDARMFRDVIGATSTTTDKRANVMIAGLSGDHRDDFGGGGLTSFLVAGTFGDLDIQTAAARATDSVTARTNGQYAKLSGSLSRLQNIFGPVSLYASIRGQLASKNLDISEKMELGGANAVRASPEGEAYGDEGYVATLEARLLLPKWTDALPGRVHLIGFVDTGHITTNKSPWPAGRNDATLSGAGVGLIWSETNDFMVSVGYAHKIGHARATSAPDAPGRFWVQLVKFF